MNQPPITTLFLDIGGVLLTNGWDRTSRTLAAKQFNIDLEEMDERHHLCFDSFERGKLTMDEYLEQVVFYEPRDFSPTIFRDFIFSRSNALPGNIEFFTSLKAKYNLKVFAVNNEAREINDYRITTFRLHKLFDAFISSCYVGLRKPDADIFRLACTLAQSNSGQSIMIDDRQMFIEVAVKQGMNAIRFDGLDSFKQQLSRLVFSPL